MMMKTLLAACIALLAAAPAAGFAAGRAPLLVRSALTRTARVHAAAEDGSSNAEPAKAPDMPPPTTGVQPSLPAPADGPALDIRLLPYVLVPLLVLASQLFLTFSRDALPTDMLGAADMTK